MLGLFFEGRASYAYTTEDAIDRQVLRDNLAHRSSARLLRDGKVTDEVTEALIFFASPLFEELWSAEHGAGEPNRPLSPDAESAFRVMWRNLRQTELEYDHLATEALLNGGGAQYVFTMMRGRRDTVGHAVDRVRYFYERLYSFRKLQGIEVRLRNKLSEQLLDGGPTEHPPVAILRKAHFDIVTEDNRSGSIISDLTVEAGRDGVRVLPMNLMNNRSLSSWAWESKDKQLQVVRVIDEDGSELPFSHRYHEILVQLPVALHRGETRQLRFETEGEVFTSFLAHPTRLSGFPVGSADDYFDLFIEPWHPEPFGWSKEPFTSTLRIRTRKPYRPVVTGTVTAFREEGKFYELEATATQEPGQLAIFAGKYKTKEQRFDDRIIRVHAYAMANDRALGTLLGLSHYFLDYFEHILGPYPFEELDIVEVPYWGFGIAPAGMVLLTSEAYNPQEGFLSRLFSRGINSRLAHEIAHQWFGHQVNSASQRDNWLTESFAEYLSGLAMAVSGADEHKVAGFKRMHEEWWREAKFAKDAGPITAANMLSGDLAFRMRYGLLYNRGPLVLHMLRTYIGDDAFFAVLREFLKRANNGMVTTEDFEATASDVLGSDLTWFFDQWIRQGGIPVLHVEHRVETNDAGEPVLVGRVEQEPDGPFKKLYLPLILEYKGGEKEVKLLFLDQPTQEFRIALTRTPKKVLVDPAHNNLVIYR